MADARLSARDAVRAAVSALKRDAVAEGVEAVHVARLDEPAAGYYLVEMPELEGGYTIAAVDDSTGALQVWARTERRALTVGPDEARRVAALGDTVSAELVWAPSRLSMSPLDPFWAVRHGVQQVYIDQRNNRWDDVAPMGPGGARAAD